MTNPTDEQVLEGLAKVEEEMAADRKRTLSQEPPFISATYQGFDVHLASPDGERRMVEVVFHDTGRLDVTLFDTLEAGTQAMDDAIVERRCDVRFWDEAARLIEEWSGIVFEAEADGRSLAVSVADGRLRLKDKALRRSLLGLRFRASGGMSVSVGARPAGDGKAAFAGTVGYPASDWFEVEDLMARAGIAFRPAVAAPYPRKGVQAPAKP